MNGTDCFPCCGSTSRTTRVRPWPWILTALAAAALYPGLRHPESGYMLVATTYMPHALRGILIAGFMAAFMSTIATQLNWGSSYLVEDFYRRFIRRDATEKHYVNISRSRRCCWWRRRRMFRRNSRRSARAGKWCWRLARGPAVFICCAGIGGGSMRGAKFPRWPRRWR